MSTRESKPESCKAALTVNGHKTGTGTVWFGCDNPHPNHEVHFSKALQARWVSVLAVFIAIIAAATLGTGVAKADPIDDIYITVLNKQGITHANGNAGLIALGHEVCNNLAAGYTEMQVAHNIWRVSQLNSYDSGYVVGAAESAYCPWYSSSAAA